MSSWVEVEIFSNPDSHGPGGRSRDPTSARYRRFEARQRQRKTIFDEYRVRERDPRWKTLDRGSGDEPSRTALIRRSASATPAARDVAAAYRALRKGAEEANDALTASDFYFGEMEMRRFDERSALLWLYWLVSGYGTRWLRSASAYLIAVAIAVAILLLAGTEPGLRLGRAVTFALSATVYAARVPDGHTLTGWGELAQLWLRTAGPLFLALTLIAIRSRVKR